MIVLDATIDRAHRDRQFGRVEAVVSLVVKETGRPVRRLRILTNVPSHGARPLRQRLIDDAVALGQRMGGRLTAQRHAA